MKFEDNVLCLFKMDQIYIQTCDHIHTEPIDDDTDICTACNEEICKHAQLDCESNCVLCGEYVQEISSEKSWTNNSYTFGNQTTKTHDHTKMLKTIGVTDDVISEAMKKYMMIDSRAKSEIPIVAACTFLAYMDTGKPKTIHEVANMFNVLSGKDSLTRSKLQKALKAVYLVFPQYTTKYITVSSMIVPLLEKLDLTKEEVNLCAPHITKIAKHIQKTWSSCEGSKRSTPQNIASVIIYKYMFRAPSFKTKFKKDDLNKKLNISSITLNNIEKTLDKLVDFS